jgi:DNA invertase Pin-like site-specific DNA recombinase
MPEPTLKIAAQYLRMSSDSQRYSLANQTDVIRSYADLHGFEVVKSYEDAGRSGVTAQKRSGLAALLSDVVSGELPYSAVLVLDVSRWGRYQDPDEAAHYEFLCRASGVSVHYCAEGFGEGYAGSIMKQLKRVMAGEYSRELSEKVRKGKRRQAELGNAQGGPCPYGLQRREVHADGTLGRVLRRDERKSRPDRSLRLEPGCEHEVAIVRRIFREYARQRRRPQAIARRLSEQGVMWTDGTPWTAIRIGATLKMDLMAGRRLIGRTRAQLGKARLVVPVAQWELVGHFEPIVSSALFEAARRRRFALGRSPSHTDAEMLNDLRKIWKKHGRISARLIEATYGAGRAYSYFNRFGSLSSAYALIEYDCSILPRPSSQALPSRDSLIAALQDVYRDQGPLRVKLIRRDERLPSPYLIRRVFGSLEAAYAVAGVIGGRKCGPGVGPRSPV